jgi:hypothetical protein
MLARFGERMREGLRFERMPNAFCVSFAFPPGTPDRSDGVVAAFDVLFSRLVTCVGAEPVEVFVDNSDEGSPLSPGRLKLLLAKYSKGGIDRLSVAVYPTAELSLMNPRVIFPVPQWEEIRLRVSRDDRSVGFDEGDWVEALLACAELLGPGYGFFTHDTIPETDTPYEAATRWGALFDDYLSKYVRGYYWANLLSPNHVQSLGGARVVLDHAPFHTVKEITGGMVYVQATDRTSSFDENALYAIGEYLRPVLHPRHHAWPKDRKPNNNFRVPYDGH